MEEAIKKAREGGYSPMLYEQSDSHYSYQWIDLGGFDGIKSEILLDPLFWEALGKTEGWSYVNIPAAFEEGDPDDVFLDWTPELAWRVNWHAFVEHLSHRKDIDSFFNELLK